VIAVLNVHGVAVKAVGAFVWEQVRCVADFTQAISSLPLARPLPLLFYHTVGDIIANARITPTGTRCYFNASSLFTITNYTPAVKQSVLNRLASLVKEYNLLVGIYVQEHIVHPRVLHAIITLYNSHLDVFQAGFSYGAVNGFCHSERPLNPVEPFGREEKADPGLGLQYYVGRADTGTWFSFLALFSQA
jgi:hypothetical protein